MVKAICFMHLSKTGGSSIRHILKKQYGVDRICQINGWKDMEDFDNLEQNKKERFDVLAGHFGMDFYRRLNKKHILFTMLRNPVDRILSHYYYVQRTPDHEFHKRGQQMSVMEYASGDQDKDIDNGYVRQLSGLDFDIGHCCDLHLETAKDNFSNYISTYGFTEHFNASVEKFASVFEWDKTLIKPEIRMNETATESKVIVSPQDLECIAEKNRFDIALYSWATNVWSATDT